MAAYPTKPVPIKQIRTDGGTQFRALDPETVQHYAALLRDGVTMDGPTLFFDGLDYWLADGFHRVSAAEAAELAELLCEVRTGTQRDARFFALTEANRKHGRPLTTAERGARLDALLTDPEWARLPREQLADLAGVSRTTVWRHQQRVEDEAALMALGARGLVFGKCAAERQSYFGLLPGMAPAYVLILSAAGWPEDRIARFVGASVERVRWVLCPEFVTEEARAELTALCETKEHKLFAAWWLACGARHVAERVAAHGREACRLAKLAGLRLPALAEWVKEWQREAEGHAATRQKCEEALPSAFRMHPDPALPQALERAADAFWWDCLDRAERYTYGVSYTEEAIAA
jgi:hypothetical protein